MSEEFSEAALISQLRGLGICNGDTVFVNADLLRPGFFVRSRKETLAAWVRILREAVGEDGTIVAPAYTKTFFRFKKDESIVFTADEPSTAGALTAAMLMEPDVVRSTHPSNSNVALGKHAERICGSHTPESPCYGIFDEISKLGGKHLMLGTIDRKNAPVAFHYSQELLKETKFTPGVGLLQTYYIDQNGDRRLYTRWDGGGCSGVGYKLFGHLLLHEATRIGYVGNAQTALTDISKSVEIVRPLLAKERSRWVCDDRMCLTCQGRWSVNGIFVILFYFKFFLTKSFSVFRRIYRR